MATRGGIPKRLLMELEDMGKPEVAAEGLFYVPDEIDVRKGTAMIIGPADTIYECCPLIFSFALPSTYPIDSPKVQILSSDGVTRFHPNLYVGGKVCLSILGTWEGPRWAPVMTIRTVLTSILGILDENPLANEPGYSAYKKDHPTAAAYSAFVEFYLASYCFKQFLEVKKGSFPALWAPFFDVFDERGEKWLERLWGKIKAKCAGGVSSKDPQHFSGVAYGMSGYVNWAALYELGLAAGLV
jgi:ubiquitin-protein ligase